MGGDGYHFQLGTLKTPSQLSTYILLGYDIEETLYGVNECHLGDSLYTDYEKSRKQVSREATVVGLVRDSS